MVNGEWLMVKGEKGIAHYNLKSMEGLIISLIIELLFF